MRSIVVGVDGSAGSVAALRWATEQARLTDAKLRVITTFSYGDVGPVGLGGMAWPATVYEEVEQNARARQEQAIEQVDGLASVEVEQRVAVGAAAEALLDAAADAELLVVGSRGRGGFAGLILGSVSHRCVSHAPCAVVVVPDPT